MKRFEKVVLLSLLLALLVGAAAHARQEDLSKKLIRLHVVAEDDSDLAQARKLLVRDAVLEHLADLEAGSAEEAEPLIRARIPELIQTARETLAACGSTAGVSVTLERERFPTREYETFALPAGEYTALRVTLGEGTGRNWWCVLFPPLCTQAVADLTETDLNEEDWSLISLDEGYTLRFQLLDWTEKLLSFFTQP